MNLPFVFKLAWRESRAARRRLIMLVASVAAGVAALVAINGFTANLRTSVGAQAKVLLGADLVISGRREFTDSIKQLVDTLVRSDTTQAEQGASAKVTSFAAMAYVTSTSAVRLVQIRGVEPGYPFYGDIQTTPEGRWATLGVGRAIVDPALLTALNAELGDTLAIGEGRFVLDATVANIPGDVGVATAFGPRVFLTAADLAVTGLLQFGSRVEYEWFIKLPSATESRAEQLAADRRQDLRTQRYRIRSVDEDREDLADTLTRLGTSLGLVALVALLLGGLGVASATHLFIRRKLDTIAILRCLGATSGQVFLAYLVQALAMGLLGSVVGAALGVGIQRFLPYLFLDLLPVDVTIAVSPAAVAVGIGLGIWVALVFALLPLLGVRRVSPLVTLRRGEEPSDQRKDPLAWVAMILLAASVYGLAAVQVQDALEGAYFAAAVGVVVLILWLASIGLIKALRRWFPTSWPYLWRQGLANLYRPANQTGTVILALGFGAFLLATLFLVQHNLLREFRVGGVSGERPNVMFFDMQPDQVAGVMGVLEAAGVEGSPPVPIIGMRVYSIRGQRVLQSTAPVDSLELEEAEQEEIEAAPNDSGPPRGWAVRREYRSTYRDSLTDSERIVAGAWWSGPRGDGPARISLDQEIAGDLRVRVGDEIVWDVQGVQVPSVVTNLREVDWGRFQTNFYVVFEDGILNDAPQMLVTLARIDSAAVRGRVQRQIAERYSNVAAIDLSQVQEVIESVLGKASLAVRFLALFSLAAGTIVLVGAVTTARLQRLREGVLLKTLGATRAQVLRIMVAEYAALGIMAAVVAIALSSVAGWALATFVFDARYDLPIGPLSGLTVLLVGLTLLVGLWSSAEVLKRPPLAILRSDT
ncbi:MAG: ABC transporter permease [Gemmatimonadales bacterium]